MQRPNQTTTASMADAKKGWTFVENQEQKLPVQVFGGNTPPPTFG
jgi:hypothetical protein